MCEIVSVVTQASKADTQNNVKGILSSVASFQEVIVGFITHSTFGIDHGNSEFRKGIKFLDRLRLVYGYEGLPKVEVSFGFA